MKKLTLMLVSNFIPIFLMSMLFFMMTLQLGDIFVNLTKFLNLDVGLSQIFYVSYLYIPKTINFALPVSLLFSVSYTLGTLYSHNELIAVLGSGVSLKNFVKPLFIMGIAFCFFYFIFEEAVVIPSFKQKNDLTRQLLNQDSSASNSNSTVMAHQGKVIYQFVYFNHEAETINGLILIELDENYDLYRRIDAEWTEWKNNVWEFRKCREFVWNPEQRSFKETYHENYTNPLFNEPPETFKRKTTKVEELNIFDAFQFVQSLKNSGLPYLDAETDFFNRLSFGFTPFLVIFLSSAIGGRYKKNVLLKSLLISLSIAVVFFVLQMMSSLFAKMGYFPTFIGSFLGVAIGYAIGILLFRMART